jgi:hypothetical protein
MLELGDREIGFQNFYLLYFNSRNLIRNFASGKWILGTGNLFIWLRSNSMKFQGTTFGNISPENYLWEH